MFYYFRTSYDISRFHDLVNDESFPRREIFTKEEISVVPTDVVASLAFGIVGPDFAAGIRDPNDEGVATGSKEEGSWVAAGAGHREKYRSWE